MRTSTTAAMIFGVLAVGVSASAQDEQAIKMKAFQDEVRSYYEQAKQYSTPKTARLNALRDQVQPLQEKLTQAKDDATRRQLTSALAPLREEMSSLAEELAKHDVEVLQQGLAFAQRRLEFAQQRLARIQAGKLKDTR